MSTSRLCPKGVEVTKMQPTSREHFRHSVSWYTSTGTAHRRTYGAISQKWDEKTSNTTTPVSTSSSWATGTRMGFMASTNLVLPLASYSPVWYQPSRYPLHPWRVIPRYSYSRAVGIPKDPAKTRKTPSHWTTISCSFSQPSPTAPPIGTQPMVAILSSAYYKW